MSLQEIIDELPKLSQEQLNEIQARLQAIGQAEPTAADLPPPAAPAVEEIEPREKFKDLLASLAGSIDGPEDWAEEHDHYIHGTPKRNQGGLR